MTNDTNRTQKEFRDMAIDADFGEVNVVSNPFFFVQKMFWLWMRKKEYILHDVVDPVTEIKPTKKKVIKDEEFLKNMSHENGLKRNSSCDDDDNEINIQCRKTYCR